MNNQIWEDAAKVISSSGGFPIPVNETTLELLKTLMTEEQAGFLPVFEKPSLNLEELKAKTSRDENDLISMLESLMKNGIITGTFNSRGVKVYRIMSFVPGILEFTMMKGETGEKEKKLAKLFDKFFGELSDLTQQNYEDLLPIFKSFPPIDRVIPVEQEIEINQEEVIPGQEASKIIDMTESIAVAHCYCRHEKDLINEPCKMNAPRENCLLLNKTAEFAIEYGYARPISREGAKKILKDAESYGLVHKIFHVHQDPEKKIEGICSCCDCCCALFQLYQRGAVPFHTYSSFTSIVNPDICSGCETCIEMCPMEAIDIEDSIAMIEQGKCIGCGICVHHCPDKAIVLKEVGHRKVFVPPFRRLNK